MKTISIMKRTAFHSSLFAVLGLGLSGAAHAATASSNMTVSAEVAASCAIDADPLAFGNYDPVVTHASSALAGATTIGVTCTSGAAATITLSQGLNAAGGSTSDLPLRRMSNGGSMLSYELYHDSGRTLVWGESIATGSDYTGTGSVSTLDVYGLIPAGQNSVTTGSYTDTVVATVNF
ncbi:MAG: hypothetical protein K0S46_2424 [Moraxellaceae bacterium]|nr:hypothetical protein [Moraxellaceae bacterium]